ncbi:hypothetical protein [uncultured Desulfosarcina sp.]|uniref:hypothetical protein n=1 Tax=uncultured Desulfosarcina sp. TaxID=218289 RepID=UPI0029C955F8|nr:hypothetical protein [uncultured Desulfosarcina sp.]
MKKSFPLLTLALVLLLSFGCSKKQNSEEPIVIPKDAAKMEVAFSWEGVEPCTSDSPEIRVSGTPAGTKRLLVKLKNITDPAWNQGGGDIEYDGSGVIPANALDIGYNGPCPPPGQRQKYEFRVMAVDAEGTIIGFGKARESYPPKK